MLSCRKWEIHSILFSHTTRVGTAIAENTLNSYFSQMEWGHATESTLSKGDLDEPILGLNGFGWHRSKSGGQRRWISGTGGIGQALSVPRLILEMSREVVKRTEPFIRLLQYGTKSLMPSRVLFH
ncbi:hypothetical protein T459_15060 [Capsicum annuum]|uniref:Uncharacterized protein n=1 Tax=Capsicum annuum TaxID=4072 RepID=A0A2G2ZJE1_CAPAN|nr:hypothetical protein T459_15060 [Capsicum annuum]